MAVNRFNLALHRANIVGIFSCLVLHDDRLDFFVADVAALASHSEEAV